ncbi:vanin-like protein 2 [Anabrus simplex]|uniref:vanin-like protein 2 n=1 Tax=Anabrus simplex TaxID=316456 RepID=UPI0035A32EE0
MATCLLLSCVLLSALIPATLQLSTPDDDSYIAAVVEYAAVGDKATEKPLDIVRQNWHKYKKIIKQAARQNADIIVFPEVGLTGMGLPANRSSLREWLVQVPDPTAREVPCTSSSSYVSEVLRNASCAAREHRLYVVINLSEECPCPSEDPTCPTDGIFIYNTNVVFDRNGTVIARYRKFNLFVEPSFNVTPTAELSTFDTDFGVRFGTFICFDLLFQAPALQLVEKLGITDFVYPTAWFSELPYLTAAETQAAWAYALDVNLLASGFNNPPNGNAGSGIYSGRLGPLDVTMPLAQSIKMLIHTVPKKPARIPISISENSLNRSSQFTDFSGSVPLSEVPTSTIGSLRFFQDDFRQYKTVLLDTDIENNSGNSTRHTDIDLCHAEFCCHFEITTDTNPEVQGERDSCDREHCGGYYYRLGVFNGVRGFAGIRLAGIQVCGIIPCTKKNDITTCGLAKHSSFRPVNVIFKSIRISGDKFQRHSSLQMPTTLTATVLPLPSSTYEFNVKEAQEDDKNEVELHTKEDVNALIGLALYGRVYDRDGYIEAQSTATSGASRL